MTTEKINEGLRKLAKPIETLREDPKNARRHPKRSIEAIAASLSTFGQQKPIVALKDGTVIAGNGTLAAALSLGWKKLAAITFDDEDTARAYAVADNRTAELSEWDVGALHAELAVLSPEQLGTVGFTADELADVAQSLGLVPPEWGDAFAALPAGERGALSQASFVLSTDQLRDVKRAIAAASAPDEQDGNRNRNGNGLAAVCRAFIASLEGRAA